MLIDIPSVSGKSEKLVLSVDHATVRDLNLYCDYAEAKSGTRLKPQRVAKLMLEKMLAQDKDFVSWKKKHGSPASQQKD